MMKRYKDVRVLSKEEKTKTGRRSRIMVIKRKMCRTYVIREGWCMDP